VTQAESGRSPRAGRGAARVLWGVVAWLVFLCGVAGALVSTLVLPGLPRRRRWVGRCARLPFRLARVPVGVFGLEQLPRRQCVLVANHASYVDGIILQAFLPPRFSYVIKGEMQRVPVAHFLLRRIGARFVDRFTAQAARDARELLRAADGGESLAFFPEGTFVRTAGLARFRSGAFAAAMRSGIPVVPVVIRGSRELLPAGAVLPRRAALEIDILEPLDPAACGDTRALIAAVRRRMLAVLGEPDLAVAPHPRRGS